MIYMTFFKEDRGREIYQGSYPFPLMSKGERKFRSIKTRGESMKTWGAMVTGGV
jgi:hypothetical protein